MPPTESSDIQYDAFISYARADGRNYAIKLYDALSERGLRPWRDERDLSPYLDFGVGIERAIRAANIVIVVMTPSIVARDDSFVRRETYYALAQSKPILLLIAPEFPEKDTPIHLTHLTYYPFPITDAEISKLVNLLPEQTASALHADDPFRQHVEDLLAFVVRRLEETIFNAPEIIALTSHDDLDRVRANPTAPPNQLPTAYRSHGWRIREVEDDVSQYGPPTIRTYENFAEAFAAHEGRVLLLGEPGAGKTTTLLAFARDKCYERLANPASSLPVYVSLGRWDGNKKFSDWIADETGLEAKELQSEIEATRVLLLLDGLDEAHIESHNTKSPDKAPRDFRIEVMYAVADVLVSTSILITSRVKDYDDTVQKAGWKIALNGGIKIEPLTDKQIIGYLRNHPELIEALEADDDLRNMARTPLLLTLLAIGYAGATEQERQELRDLSGSPIELRARIFDLYFDGRYEFERAKGMLLPSREKFIEVLGTLAFKNSRSWKTQRGVIDREDLQSAGSNEAFAETLTRLHLLIAAEEHSFRFIHLLMRDHFAFYGALAALHSADAEIRVSAANTLGGFGDPRATEPLCDVLRDRHPDVRRSAAHALGEIGDPRATEPLCDVLRDRHPDVRRSAADALGKIGDPRATEPLCDVLRDRHPDVRRSAADSLGKIVDLRATEPLCDALRDAKADVRATSAHALGEIGDPRAANPLVNALRDRNDVVRIQAANSLGRIGSPALELLVLLLRDKSAMVRCGAAAALGVIADPHSTEPLIDAMKDKDAAVRYSATLAVSQIDSPVTIEPLIASLLDEDILVRICASGALRKIGTPEALDAVRKYEAGEL